MYPQVRVSCCDGGGLAKCKLGGLDPQGYLPRNQKRARKGLHFPGERTRGGAYTTANPNGGASVSWHHGGVSGHEREAVRIWDQQPVSADDRAKE